MKFIQVLDNAIRLNEKVKNGEKLTKDEKEYLEGARKIFKNRKELA